MCVCVCRRNLDCPTYAPQHTAEIRYIDLLYQCSRQQPHDPILRGNFYTFHVEKCIYRI